MRIQSTAPKQHEFHEYTRANTTTNKLFRDWTDEDDDSCWSAKLTDRQTETQNKQVS